MKINKITIDKHQHGDILILYVKNVDEDSRLYAKISASRRQ